jgi:hypothetical protein
MALPSATRIDAMTPAGRNRYADFLRLASITVVVLGHWLLAVVTSDGTGVRAGHLLGEVPATQWLTWVFQVLPVFFFVGGFANAAAWSSASGRGERWAAWVRLRGRRLLGPVVPLLVVWVPLALLLRAAGVPADLLHLATQVVIVPAWFLAVYLMVVALVPLTFRWHRRHGLHALAGMAGAAALVDLAHQAGVPGIGWLNFLLVWAAIHQVGYVWFDGRLPAGFRHGVLLAAAGFAGLALLTGALGYPVSMVGVDGAVRSNTGPPTVALLALATAQVGLVIAARRRAEAWLARPRVWAAVVVGGGAAMTVYLWHMTALVAVAGLTASRWPAEVGAAWWMTRPLWFAACGVALAGLVAAFSRFERPAPGAPAAAPAWRAGAGVLLSSGGLGLLVTGGLLTAGGALAVGPLVLFGAGTAALHAGSGRVGRPPRGARREAASR